MYLSTRYTPFFGRPLKISRNEKNKPVGVHGGTLCPPGRSRTHNPHYSFSDDFDAVMVVSLRGRSMDTPAGTRDRFSLPLDRGTRTTRTAVDTRSDTTARQKHHVLGICPPVNYFTRLSSAAILCTTEKWTAVLSLPSDQPATMMHCATFICRHAAPEPSHGVSRKWAGLYLAERRPLFSSLFVCAVSK